MFLQKAAYLFDDSRKCGRNAVDGRGNDRRKRGANTVGRFLPFFFESRRGVRGLAERTVCAAYGAYPVLNLELAVTDCKRQFCAGAAAERFDREGRRVAFARHVRDLLYDFLHSDGRVFAVVGKAGNRRTEAHHNRGRV